MEQKHPKSYTKITKATLVIYCLIIVACLIALLTASAMVKDYSYLYGFLLCVGPGFIFVFISCLFPISQLFSARVGKATIAWCVIAYILKYAAIIGIPFIGIVYAQYFNRWTMLATTLIAPITVIINKIIFANVVSKSAKKEQK